jgi:hypothetical protein
MNEQAPLLFGFLNQEAAAIAVSTIVGFILGWLTLLVTIWFQGGIARTTLTFQMVNEKIWDQDYLRERLAFSTLRESGRSFAMYAHLDPTCDEFKDRLKESLTIQAILTDYENTAIGIRRGILDEEYLFRYTRSSLIRDWETASPYVIALRTKCRIPQIYVEFEGLASQWPNNKSYAKPKRPLRFPERHVSVV